MDHTDKIQKELQNIVGYSMSQSLKISYQDAMNVAIFTKLAELELKIEALQNEKFNNISIVDLPALAAEIIKQNLITH